MVESCSDGLGFHDLFDYYCVFAFQLKSRSRKVFSIQRLQGTCDKSVVFSQTPVSSTNKTSCSDGLGFHDLFDYYCVFAFECLYLK
jgi:hypothetical protein